MRSSCRGRTQPQFAGPCCEAHDVVPIHRRQGVHHVLRPVRAGVVNDDHLVADVAVSRAHARHGESGGSDSDAPLSGWSVAPALRTPCAQLAGEEPDDDGQVVCFVVGGQDDAQQPGLGRRTPLCCWRVSPGRHVCVRCAGCFSSCARATTQRDALESCSGSGEGEQKCHV